jgi:hypothetical protein
MDTSEHKSEHTSEFIYILSNPDWIQKCKYGYTTNPTQRFASYKTYSSHPFNVERIWKIDTTQCILKY